MMTTGMSWFLLEHLAVVRYEERLREAGRRHPGGRNCSSPPAAARPVRCGTGAGAGGGDGAGFGSHEQNR